MMYQFECDAVVSTASMQDSLVSHAAGSNTAQEVFRSVLSRFLPLTHPTLLPKCVMAVSGLTGLVTPESEDGENSACMYENPCYIGSGSRLTTINQRRHVMNNLVNIKTSSTMTSRYSEYG